MAVKLVQLVTSSLMERLPILLSPQVCSPDTGDMFYMLHQRGEGGAMTLATL